MALPGIFGRVVTIWRRRSSGWRKRSARALGYDVLSFDDADESEKLIEVKTTGLGKFFPFFVTVNEVRCT